MPKFFRPQTVYRKDEDGEFQDTGIGALQFKTFGDWDGVIKKIQTLSPKIKRAGLQAQIRTCKVICQKVKAHIHHQDLSWRPLTRQYRTFKENAGLEMGILTATNAYYNNIEVIVKGNQHLAYVGVRRGIYGKGKNGKRNKYSLAEVAAIHEFSHSEKRRRPLWNPTIAEMGGPEGIKNMFLGFFYAELRMRHVPVELLRGSGIRINNRDFTM